MSNIISGRIRRNVNRLVSASSALFGDSSPTVSVLQREGRNVVIGSQDERVLQRVDKQFKAAGFENGLISKTDEGYALEVAIAETTKSVSQLKLARKVAKNTDVEPPVRHGNVTAIAFGKRVARPA